MRRELRYLLFVVLAVLVSRYVPVPEFQVQASSMSPGFGVSGPCFNNARSKFVINNLSTNTLVAAGVANKNIYVCEYYIAPVAAAANVELVEGITGACTANTLGLQGGATAATGANLAINGGFVQPFTGLDDWGSTTVTGNSLCIFTSAAVNGILKYVIF